MQRSSPDAKEQAGFVPEQKRHDFRMLSFLARGVAHRFVEISGRMRDIVSMSGASPTSVF
ncbi:hypothetical protein G3N56_17815 [Desulfovibrio sulfodismutans]|uniref:Uncharacterized protein n=1 Tax=Desulfolutivibrio sulfodismutans TaxID=63561 RepID=A0A7K3NS18_9BACT|nr:hypothetical protein [Desulfolutivibrio sulfodismutans]NDY58595.1 hypothetical protein [Desulfolutivibrio sulfodismutans]QLA14635.1 hypothetical protein GD606_20025 [Desulfolutivibrio sulfodismutans DSM 3696]